VVGYASRKNADHVSADPAKERVMKPSYETSVMKKKANSHNDLVGEKKESPKKGTRGFV